MVATKRKFGLISVLAIVIALASGRAEAFPVVWSDIERILTEGLNAIQQGYKIKNEIDENMALVKEAQERGYSWAAQDLFRKVQNGDFDRFGNELSGLKGSAFNATHSAKAVQDRKEQMEKMLQAEETAGNNNSKSNEQFGKKIYKWLENNRAATDAGFNAFDNIKNGDVANAVRNATGGAESALGENGQGLGTLGNIGGATTDIINNSGNLGDAASNAATNGELRGAINSLPEKDNGDK